MTDILNILFYTLLFVALYAQVFLLVSFMEMEEKERIQRKKKNAAGVLANNGGIEGVRADDLPTVTVLVPCYNEAETVAPTIESIRALDYPQDKLSILVIDDGSTDNTSEVARHHGVHHVIRLTKRKGLANGLPPAWTPA